LFKIINYMNNLTYLRWFLIFSIGLMPLLAPIWLGVDYVFQPTPEDMKTTFGIVSVFFGITLWFIIQYKNKKIIIQQSEYYIPIIGFILWCFISLTWVEDGFIAIVMLAQFISYGLIFFLTVNAFKNEKNFKLIFKVLIVILFAVSFLGLLQHYLVDSSFIQNLFLQAHPPGATFANKNMATHFVVIVLPLSLVMFLEANNSRHYIYYSLVLFVATLFLMYTYSRQAYLAIFIELSFFSIFIAFDYMQNKSNALILKVPYKKEKVAAILLIIVSLILIPSTLKNEQKSESKIIQKISKINIQGGSGRFPAWVNTIEMIKDHPIRGVGVGQWPESYPKYYDSNMKDVIFNEKLRLSRLHNDYLEMFANVGLIGYIFLIWIVILTIKKTLFVLINISNENRGLVLGTTLGLLGFSISAMFSFPVRVYLPVFLVFIFLAFISINSPNKEFIKIITNKSKKYFFIGIVTLCLILIFISNRSYSWLMGQHHYITAMSYMNNGHIESAKNEVMVAINYNSWAQDYYNLAGNALATSVNVESAIPYYKKVINISPFNTLALLNLSISYQLTGNTQMERKVLDFILRFDPKNVRAAARLVINLTNNKEYKNANIVFKKLKNNFNYFKGRSGFGPYHIEVARVGMFVGDYEYVSFVYHDLIDSKPTSENYATLASIEYYYLDHKEKGVNYYKEAIKINPNMPKNNEIMEMIKKYEFKTIH